MKAVVEKTRKYYKYYTLPTMTSNTTPEGTVEANTETSAGYTSDAYKLWFNTAFEQYYYNAYAYNNQTVYNQYTFKNLIKAGTYTLSFKLRRQRNVQTTNRKFIIIDENDNEIEVWSLASNLPNADTEYSYSISIDVPTFKAIKYVADSKSISSSYICDYVYNLNINNLKIVADAQDYDFYEDTYKADLSAEVERTYYKYVYEPWAQPVLTSNGTMSGDSFACTQDKYYPGCEAYRLFDNDNSSNWNTYDTSNPNQGIITIYNPTPLKITTINILNYVHPQGAYNYSFTNVNVQGSNDSINWENISSTLITSSVSQQTLTLNSSDSFKYYKFECTTSAYNIACNTWTIGATQRFIQESTEQDYDFYKDINTYKAIKSYEKGQYYGN